MFDQGTLVLEGVALAQMVEFVVEVLVDFAGGAVFYQEAAEDAEAAHPHYLAVFPGRNISHRRSPFTSLQMRGEKTIPRHPRIRRPLPLPETPMSPDPPRSRQLPRPRARVHSHRLADDEPIGDELADRLAGIGV